MDRITRRITKRTVLLTIGLLGVLSAPLALAAGEGGPVRAGQRNPVGLGTYGNETQIIANNSTYGTRQSNKSGNGGGAIYGCRSRPGGTPSGNRPCIRSNNIVDGLAFEFASGGALVGTITAGKGGDNAKPFTTNATGVATGLNADRVDGKSSDDFLAKDAKAVDADKVDGKDSADFAAAGDLLFAAVNAAGNVTANRGAASASYAASTNTFTVVFNRDVNACSYTATETGAAASDVQFAAAPVAGNTKAITVDESGNTAVPFHVQVIC